LGTPEGDRWAGGQCNWWVGRRETWISLARRDGWARQAGMGEQVGGRGRRWWRVGGRGRAGEQANPVRYGGRSSWLGGGRWALIDTGVWAGVKLCRWQTSVAEQTVRLPCGRCVAWYAWWAGGGDRVLWPWANQTCVRITHTPFHYLYLAVFFPGVTDRRVGGQAGRAGWA